MGHKDKKPRKHTIKIDRDNFQVEVNSMTGQQLRALPEPDIGEELDLFLEGRGQDRDRLIEPTDQVEIRSGLRFFTAARSINPGATR